MKWAAYKNNNNINRKGNEEVATQSTECKACDKEGLGKDVFTLRLVNCSNGGNEIDIEYRWALQLYHKNDVNDSIWQICRSSVPQANKSVCFFCCCSFEIACIFINQFERYQKPCDFALPPCRHYGMAIEIACRKKNALDVGIQTEFHHFGLNTLWKSTPPEIESIKLHFAFEIRRQQEKKTNKQSNNNKKTPTLATREIRPLTIFVGIARRSSTLIFLVVLL